MINLDRKVAELCSYYGTYYRRYSDDILVLCAKNFAAAIKERIYKLIEEETKLEWHPDKTVVAHYSPNQSGSLSMVIIEGKQTPFQYLGLSFDGSQIGIRTQSIGRYHQRAKKLAWRTGLKAWYHGKRYNINAVRIFRRKLYEKLTHLGPSTIRYAHRVAKLSGSPLPKQQIRKHFEKVKSLIAEAEQRNYDEIVDRRRRKKPRS